MFILAGACSKNVFPKRPGQQGAFQHGPCAPFMDFLPETYGPHSPYMDVLPSHENSHVIKEVRLSGSQGRQNMLFSVSRFPSYQHGSLFGISRFPGHKKCSLLQYFKDPRYQTSSFSNMSRIPGHQFFCFSKHDIVAEQTKHLRFQYLQSPCVQTSKSWKTHH